MTAATPLQHREQTRPPHSSLRGAFFLHFVQTLKWERKEVETDANRRPLRPERRVSTGPSFGLCRRCGGCKPGRSGDGALPLGVGRPARGGGSAASDRGGRTASARARGQRLRRSGGRTLGRGPARGGGKWGEGEGRGGAGWAAPPGALGSWMGDRGAIGGREKGGSLKSRWSGSVGRGRRCLPRQM